MDVRRENMDVRWVGLHLLKINYQNYTDKPFEGRALMTLRPKFLHVFTLMMTSMQKAETAKSHVPT